MPDDNEKYEFSWPKFVMYCKNNGIGEWTGSEFDNWVDLKDWWSIWTAAIRIDRRSK